MKTNRGMGFRIHDELEVTCGLGPEVRRIPDGGTLANVEYLRKLGWRQSDKYGWVCPEHVATGILKDERQYLQSFTDLAGDPGE